MAYSGICDRCTTPKCCSTLLECSEESEAGRQELFDAALRLLDYSWMDIGYKYDGLTPIEKSQITEEEFNRLAVLVRRVAIR